MSLERSLKKVSTGISMHVPGHKNNTIGTLDLISAHLDLTEVPELDDLHEPEEVLYELNYRLGALYGRYAQLMVNGTTTGIMAAIHALNNKNNQFFIIGNAHKSVYNALDLIDKNSMIYAQEKINKGDVVILTSPTYYGETYNVKNIARIVKRKGGYLIVDEAHGAHLGITENFPKSASVTEADIVIQSYHKMLPALTGASVIFIQDKNIYNKVMQYIGMFETSSPSYLIMLSIEHALNFYLNFNDETFFNKRECLIEQLKENNYKVQTLDDPAKLLINKIDTSPYNLEASFRKKRIYSEMVTNRGVLWCLPLWHEGDSYPFYDLLSRLENLEIIEPKARIIDLSILEHKKAVETITPYPPGIPIIIRNRTITRGIIETIGRLIERNVKIEGLRQNLDYYSE